MMRTLILLVMGLGCLPAQVSYPDFRGLGPNQPPPLLSLNGDATTVNNRLLLHSNNPSRAGSAFLQYPLDVLGGFEFTFSFRMRVQSDNGGSGFAFVLHNDPRADRALGDPDSTYGIGLTGTLASSGVLDSKRVPDPVPVVIPDDPSIYGVMAVVQGIGIADLVNPLGAFTNIYRGRIYR